MGKICNRLIAWISIAICVTLLPVSVWAEAVWVSDVSEIVDSFSDGESGQEVVEAQPENQEQSAQTEDFTSEEQKKNAGISESVEIDETETDKQEPFEVVDIEISSAESTEEKATDKDEASEQITEENLPSEIMVEQEMLSTLQEGMETDVVMEEDSTEETENSLDLLEAIATYSNDVVALANTTVSTATTISTNALYVDNLTSSSDVNYYKFTLSSAGYISFSFSHEYVESSNPYWSADLYNTDNDWLTGWYYEGNYSGTSTSTKIGVPAGTYYIKITRYNSSWHSTKPYKLKVNYTSSSAWEKEFNDSVTTADHITVGTAVNGSLRLSGDVDYYQVKVPETSYYRLNFKHDFVDSGYSYWDVKLYDMNMSQVASYCYVGNVTSETEDSIKLTAGTYYLKVYKDYYGYSDASYALTLKKYVKATSITSLKNYSSGLKVQWNVVEEATGYYVYRKVGGGSWKKVKTTTATSWIDKGATSSGTEYQYKIYAYSGKSTSAASSSRLIYKLKSPTISSVTNTSSGIKVKWGNISGATGYYVYRKVGTGSWKKVKTTTATSWTDTGAASNGKKYQYKVYAYKGNSLSVASSAKKEYRLTTTGITSVSNSSGKKLTVKWKKNSAATGYQIKYVTGSNEKTVTVSGASTLKKVIAGLAKGKTYKVYVRSYKTVSGTKYYSGWSSAKSIKITK